MKCARTVCPYEGTCKHTQTGQLYCIQCARKINAVNAGGVKNLIEIPPPEQRQRPRRAKTLQ